MAKTHEDSSSRKRGEQEFLSFIPLQNARKFIVLCFGICLVWLIMPLASTTASAHVPLAASFLQAGSPVPSDIAGPINSSETHTPPTPIPTSEQKDTSAPCPACNYKIYGIPVVRVQLLTPPTDKLTSWEKFRDFVIGLWPQVKDVLFALCLGVTVIYIIIFLMLTYWGFREKLIAFRSEAQKHRAPVKYFSTFLYELFLFIAGPLLYPLSIIIQIVLWPIYLLAYLSVAVIGIAGALLISLIKKLKEIIIIGARKWVRNGKALYEATRHFDKKLERWHIQFTHSVDLRVQLITSWKNLSDYFIESGFLKTSTQLGRTDDAIMTLSTVVRDETHPIFRRKKAVDGLLKLAENCHDCSPDKISEIEQTLLLLAQDTALDPKIRIHSAWVLTLYARRSIPWENPAYFSEKSAYQAWKNIATDRQLKPPAVRIGAINMIRKRLGHLYLAQRDLCELLTCEFNNHQTAESEFCIRATHLLLLMMAKNGNHTDQKATIPLDALRQMSLCESCPPELQYLAVFGIGEFARQPEATKIRLLRPSAEKVDEKDQPLIPYIEETGPLLLRLVKAGKRETRLKAVAALRRFGHTGILEKLATTLEWKLNDDLTVRKCAAGNLAKLDSRKGAAAWRTIAEDKDIDILDRLDAAEQALMNGEQYGHQYLLQIGANHSEEHRWLAAKALIRCNYIEEGRSILILLSRDVIHNRDLARQAFGELSKLPN